MGHEPITRDAALLVELQHRARNTLATTRMIARRSAETSENLEEYVAHLDGRLAALARVQNSAIRDPLAGIDLSMLVSDEITSAGLGASTRIDIEGPPLAVHPRTAEPIALALHELMTNAIKFGAMSVSEGRLAISWQIEANGVEPRRLLFEWTETSVHLPQVEERRRGFGMIVLLDMLKHNLDARTSLAFEPTGLTCRIVMPLTDRFLPAF